MSNAKHMLPAPTSPILAPLGASAAEASRPDQLLEDDKYHVYEANPAPWWVGLVWLCFFVFGVIYLSLNLGS